MKKSLLDQFVDSGRKLDFNFNFSRFNNFRYEPLKNDALFHLPLICICVLVISKEWTGQVLAGQMGRLVGILIENTIPGFKGSSQTLSWSTTLRYRAAEATSFLEQLKFISVSKDHRIEVSDAGNKFLLGIRREDSDLGLTLRALLRNASDIQKKSEGLL